MIDMLPIEVTGQGACYWNKMRVLEKYISFFDWILWLDADIVIWNHSVNFDPWISKTTKHVLIQDRASRGVGAGALLVRNSRQSRVFFR